MGAQSAPEPDAAYEAERARLAALAALAKPISRDRGPAHDIGDGDKCPLAPHHGKMFVIGQKQYCAHHEHDAAVRTRSLWPLHGFEEAVANYQPPQEAPALPDIAPLEV